MLNSILSVLSSTTNRLYVDLLFVHSGSVPSIIKDWSTRLEIEDCLVFTVSSNREELLSFLEKNHYEQVLLVHVELLLSLYRRSRCCFPPMLSNSAQLPRTSSGTTPHSTPCLPPTIILWTCRQRCCVAIFPVAPRSLQPFRHSCFDETHHRTWGGTNGSRRKLYDKAVLSSFLQCHDWFQWELSLAISSFPFWKWISGICMLQITTGISETRS